MDLHFLGGISCSLYLVDPTATIIVYTIHWNDDFANEFRRT